ncbi:MAG TPA: hypothetical protein VFK30_05930, partial [Anaerolineae bacterium]|nr:hypothetical protein [Anaerolineae bacterium]
RDFAFKRVTLQGFFAVPHREIGWHTVSIEFNDFAIEQLQIIDTLMFWRVADQIINQHRIMVNPVILGNRKPLFNCTMNKHDLNLL